MRLFYQVPLLLAFSLTIDASVAHAGPLEFCNKIWNGAGGVAGLPQRLLSQWEAKRQAKALEKLRNLTQEYIDATGFSEARARTAASKVMLEKLGYGDEVAERLAIEHGDLALEVIKTRAKPRNVYLVDEGGGFAKAAEVLQNAGASGITAMQLAEAKLRFLESAPNTGHSFYGDTSFVESDFLRRTDRESDVPLAILHAQIPDFFIERHTVIYGGGASDLFTSNITEPVTALSVSDANSVLKFFGIEVTVVSKGRRKSSSVQNLLNAHSSL